MRRCCVRTPPLLWRGGPRSGGGRVHRRIRNLGRTPFGTTCHPSSLSLRRDLASPRGRICCVPQRKEKISFLIAVLEIIPLPRRGGPAGWGGCRYFSLDTPSIFLRKFGGTGGCRGIISTPQPLQYAILYRQTYIRFAFLQLWYLFLFPVLVYPPFVSHYEIVDLIFHQSIRF